MAIIIEMDLQRLYECVYLCVCVWLCAFTNHQPKIQNVHDYIKNILLTRLEFLSCMGLRWIANQKIHKNPMLS